MKARADTTHRETWSVIGLLALATFAVYGNSLWNGFVWDDLTIVVRNIETARLVDIPGLFVQPDSVADLGAPYYRPVNRSTYVLDSVLYGNRPAGHHLGNVILHLLGVLALYFTSLELFGRKQLALIASLLFAVHPVNTEAVDFISARNNLLTTFFVLASFLSYIKGDSDERVPLLYISAFLFFLGLLCKETAAMLLPVLAFYRFIVFRRGDQLPRLVVRLWPFAALLAVYLGLRANALSGMLGMDLQLEDLGRRLSHNSAILPRYLGLFLLPIGLSVSRLVPEGGYPVTFWLVFSWIAIPAILYVLWRTDRPATRLGLFWFAVHYLPISNLVPIPSAPMAERFIYLPAIGIWWIVADQFCGIYDRATRKGFLQAASAAVLIVLACLSFQRNFDWKSNVSLFEKEVRVNPSLAENHYNLCTGYFEVGDFVRAEAACITAEDLDPGYGNALTQLGNLQQAQGRHSRAISFYQKAVEADPRHLNARYNLARLLENLGQLEQAFRHYEAVQRMLPADHVLQSEIRIRLQGRLQGIATSGRPPLSNRRRDSGPAPDAGVWLGAARVKYGLPRLRSAQALRCQAKHPDGPEDSTLPRHPATVRLTLSRLAISSASAVAALGAELQRRRRRQRNEHG
jgi:tetratricopeptide (TPR) repeat protein